MTYRIVVTGHTPEGASTCLEDQMVTETPGWMFNFWGTDRTPADNSAGGGTGSPGPRLAPPPAGTLFRIFHILPDRDLAGMTQEDLAEISAKIGAKVEARAGERLWHRTDTVDYVVILSGRVTLHLDNGDVELGPRDVVVQRGTHHAWSNQQDEVAAAVCIMVGAHPLDVVPPAPTPDRLVIGL